MISIIIGLVALIYGGDWLVDSAVVIARKARLSPMVIGLTVIGFGTSMPELLVSLQAALADTPGIAIGNVVGSNISNIALIFGASALLCPLPASRSTLRIDMPFVLLASILFVGIACTGSIERIPGLLLFALLVTYVSWQIKRSRKSLISQEQAATAAEQTPKAKPSFWFYLLFWLPFSFALLVLGARLLVDGATDIARQLGVEDRIIGLTIVAVGTSLPELFASVIAARKGETDMAIGNIIGSVSFNILCVVGLSAAICPIQNSNVGFLTDYMLMTFLIILLWFFLGTKRLLERWEGAVLLAIYLIYLIWTVIA